jgi:hypothetical protein
LIPFVVVNFFAPFSSLSFLSPSNRLKQQQNLVGKEKSLTEGEGWHEYTQSGSRLLLFQIFEFLINQNYVSLLSLVFPPSQPLNSFFGVKAKTVFLGGEKVCFSSTTIKGSGKIWEEKTLLY